MKIKVYEVMLWVNRGCCNTEVIYITIHAFN